jgi:hypothetical protein
MEPWREQNQYLEGETELYWLSGLGQILFLL